MTPLSPEPKSIIVFSVIMIIFALALLVPSIVKSKQHPCPDEDLLGEEGAVTH